MEQRLITSTGVLSRVLKAIAPAAVKKPPLVPTHFTETVLVQPTPDDSVEFTCTDGFRMHTADVWQEYIKFEGDGPMVVGLHWLQTTIKGLGRKEATVEVVAESMQDPAKRAEVWTIAMDVDKHLRTEDHEPFFRYNERFDIGGRWPNVNSLIEHGEILTGVGFNPGYVFDMVTAARSWWDVDTPDETFPLQVLEFHPQKVCTFTLRNAIGRLRITIMPKVSDDDEY